ncbi:hypothetical protein K1719_025145 [Acacia pycnantha]|nr:hypothetical protein K1719_025145 [Acacia pycnantha]
MGFLLKFFYALLATLLFLLQTRLSLVANVEAINRCIGKERKALLLFKQGIHIDGFDALSTWRDGDNEDCCNWKGVSCSNKTGHVQILDLHSLGGRINITLLSELHDLKHLNLSGFEFGFYLSEIPESIELFTNLRYLNLSSASFAGSIPSQLGKLSDLLYLDLSNNYFDGAIPWQIGNLSKLQYLNLQQNHLVGVIPYQLGNLSMLHTLQLGYNVNLTIANQNNDGVEWISKLSLLTDLDLSYVSGVGYSQIWLHMMTGNLVPKLRELRLSGCGISYADNFPLYASPLNYSSSLVILDLSYNNLNRSSLFQWPFNFSSSLQELYLMNCSLLTDNLYLLFSNSHLPSLTVLDLSLIT